ncbi:hypothetical protein Pmani_028700 [Petrolisthes manimaculis]|uniref:Heparan sulfate 2-O-sulfotransferase pipe n=1 Tax=Petrolisthes manimaculis TaxID=1843537 RepID=A0AAE1NZK0_9EUCA|nr:hypothetical protein Pmani_028700 [Petrolisthes manimaculis]
MDREPRSSTITIFTTRAGHYSAFSSSSSSSSQQNPSHAHTPSRSDTHANTHVIKTIAAPDHPENPDRREQLNPNSERKGRLDNNGKNTHLQSDNKYRTVWKEYGKDSNHSVINRDNQRQSKNDLGRYYNDNDDGDEYGEYYDDETEYRTSDNYDEQGSKYENEESGEEYHTNYNADGYDASYDDVSTEGQYYNVTPDTAMMMYNRVPKCASSTIQTILRRLSRRLGFRHESSVVFDQRQLNEEEQLELLKNLTTLAAISTEDFSYDRHLYYTNFTLVGGPRPVYINFIRDPVERFISSYYYVRSEERITRLRSQGHHYISPPPNWTKRSVGECVLSKLPECTFSHGENRETMVTYFCGHHHFCRLEVDLTVMRQSHP